LLFILFTGTKLSYKVLQIKEFTDVKFYDMEFDNPESHVIRNLPEVRGFMGIPFTIYYKNGKVVKATSSIQTREQVKAILDKQFAAVVTA